MTLSSLTTKTTFAGDGSTTSFATGFVFWNSSDLKIILVSSSGGETTYTEGTHYTVTGGLGASGTVSVSSSVVPESGEDLLIKSNVALLQGTDLPTGGQFNSEDVESELDRMVRRVQQQSEQFDRTPQLAEASTYTGVTVPNPSSGKVLGWSTDANFENLAVNSSAYLAVPIPVASGGTGAASASSARYALGVAIGTDVQAYDADLLAIAALTHSSSVYRFMVSDGSSWTTATSSSALSILGLSASYQPLDTNLTNIAALTPVAGQLIGYSSSGAEAVVRAPFTNKGYATNRYYSGLQTWRTGTLAVTANRLYGAPFVCLERTTFTRLGIEVTGAAGTSARLGIHDWAPSSSDWSLVVDAGTVSTASTGAKEATISQVLMPGPYILSCVFDSTATVRSSFQSNLTSEWFTGYTGEGDGVIDTIFYTAHAFAALPDPFGTPTYYDNAATNLAPLIWLRVV